MEKKSLTLVDYYNINQMQQNQNNIHLNVVQEESDNDEGWRSYDLDKKQFRKIRYNEDNLCG